MSGRMFIFQVAVRDKRWQSTDQKEKQKRVSKNVSEQHTEHDGGPGEGSECQDSVSHGDFSNKPGNAVPRDTAQMAFQKCRPQGWGLGRAGPANDRGGWYVTQEELGQYRKRHPAEPGDL